MRSLTEKSELRDWIRKNCIKAKSRDDFFKEAVSRFNKSRERIRNTVYDMIKRGEDLGETIGVGCAAVKVKQIDRRVPFRFSVDVSEIKKEYDDESRILEGISALGTRLIKDNDFRIELGIPVERWRVVSSLAGFVQNKRELRGKLFKGIYWGNKEVMIDLAKKIDMLP